MKLEKIRRILSSFFFPEKNRLSTFLSLLFALFAPRRERKPFWQTASDADPLISPRRCTSYSERTRSRGEKALESRWKKSEGFYPLSSFLKRTVFQLFFPYFSRFLLRVESGSPSVGADLSSRAVTGKVFSALRSLTSVFGMGTGGPSGIRYRLSETTVPEN